jgi:hypothetical protein
MKKQLLLLLAILCIYTTQAQKVNVLAKAGANFGKIKGKEFKDGYNVSYHAGASVEINFNNTFGLQPEVLFSQTKAKTINSGTIIVPFDKDIHLNYLSIPLLLRINAGKIITFHAGPEFSILMNNNNTLVVNGENAFKNGNLSLIGGLQVNLPTLRIYGRYNVGVSQLQDISNTDKWRYETIQLGVAFKII